MLSIGFVLFFAAPGIRVGSSMRVIFCGAARLWKSVPTAVIEILQAVISNRSTEGSGRSVTMFSYFLASVVMYVRLVEI